MVPDSVPAPLPVLLSAVVSVVDGVVPVPDAEGDCVGGGVCVTGCEFSVLLQPVMIATMANGNRFLVIFMAFLFEKFEIVLRPREDISSSRCFTQEANDAFELFQIRSDLNMR